MLKRRAILSCALLPLAATACASSGSTGNDVTRIAFVQDLAAPDADEHALPALQAAQLAIAMQSSEGVRVELTAFDLAEDPSAVAQIESDPSFVAAIAGPGADGSTMAEAGVPTVSVSTAGPTPDAGAWRRSVAPIEFLADAIVAELEGSEPCVLSEEPAPDPLVGLLTQRLGEPSAILHPAETGPFVAENECDAVAWAGSPDAGAEVTRSLPDGVAVVGGDRLLDPDFLDAGSAAEGARAVCACVDLSTSIDPAAMRFIQDYQSEFGSAPGPYAVEAWDATRLLLGLLAQGTQGDRVAAALVQVESLEGLGGPYRFATSGVGGAPRAASACPEPPVRPLGTARPST
jgi:branched-chain amino acid transport system substrate-binding protein